ncbi:hypothetical protein QJ856_gp0341 [Tupanvirus deep ocean]|uniref:Uncharacterized protein n=2 Tax=Tupanvirus TaxID=2094720 RepID=A0AC62A9R8_9VIRU|nr:hypothetical protein QJ856_gp0341 [Tupanvirus deep ocean]QKU34395.1 hypothetical protein [Tupanvirus deep ocean]
MDSQENTLLTNKHLLICLDAKSDPRLDYLVKNFCGLVVTDVLSITLDLVKKYLETNGQIYFCGSIQKFDLMISEFFNLNFDQFYVIKELSEYECTKYHIVVEKNVEYFVSYHIVDLGQVPINIHGVGVYFRKFFDEKDYFNLVKSEHQFQVLTESNKPNNAFRKGIYLSKVEEQNGYKLFNLLRCSSNFEGPTDNFRPTDLEIVSNVNAVSEIFFEQKTDLNHVLAQIYENNPKGKATIKAHSDKTKDMPRNGLIAFCTFYDNTMLNDPKMRIKKSQVDDFDYCYNETSVLTRLHFKLKDTVVDNKLVKEFSVVLYPNSLFIIPLSTNRLYTHEIRPSVLPHDKIPTRMGYVIRCSKTKAIYRDNETFYSENNIDYAKLMGVNDDDLKGLRTLYFLENTTPNLITYGKINFSMNKGDYLEPNL